MQGVDVLQAGATTTWISNIMLCYAMLCRLLDARTLFDIPSQLYKSVTQVRDISTSFLCLILIQPFLSLVTVLITLGSVRQTPQVPRHCQLHTLGPCIR